MGYTVYYTIYRSILISQQNKINTFSIQGLEGHKMIKQLLVKTEQQLRQLSFVLFSWSEEEF